MAMSNHYILRHYNVYKCISKLYCYLPVVCLFQINTVVRTPPPPTWKIQHYLFNIVNEEMGPDPIPLENLNFKIKLLEVCLGPPDPASTIILRTPYPLKIMDPRKFQKVHLLPKMSFYTAIIIFKL